MEGEVGLVASAQPRVDNDGLLGNHAAVVGSKEEGGAGDLLAEKPCRISWRPTT